MKIHSFLIFALISVVKSLPTGAPDEVCDEKNIKLIPKHGPSALSGKSAPYTVTATSKHMSDKKPIEVTIKSKDASSRFKGFAIAVRHENMIIGQWRPNSKAHTIKCNVITHNNNDPKDNITLTWNPPKSSSGSVDFLVTIVKDRETFWTEVPVEIRHRK